MYLCPECFLQGQCRALNAQLVTDAEIDRRDFVMDVRDYAQAMDLGRDAWAPLLIDAYRDYPGVIADADGVAVDLDTSVFDAPNMRYWFRDFIIAKRDSAVGTFVRREARERVRVMATILRAIDPVGARLWGARAANDGTYVVVPTLPHNTGCPYRDPAKLRTLISYRR